MKHFWSVLLAAGLLCAPVRAFAADSDDTLPPTVERIVVRQSTVSPGGAVTISADAEDDETGVKSITVYFRHEEEDVTFTAKLLRNSDEDVAAEYSGVLPLPDDAPPGQYRLSRVLAADRAGNRAVYADGIREWDDENHRYPLEWPASFQVKAGTKPLPPVSCAVSTRDGGYRVTLDAGGNEVDKATLLFENDANHHKYALSLSENDLQANGTYRKELPVAEHEPSGTFTLKKVTIKNTAKVKQTWSSTVDEDSDDLPLPIAAAFSVQSALPADKTPPVLHAVQVGEGVRDAEDEKTRYPLNVVVTDDLSGVDHITVKFKEPRSGETIRKVLRSGDLRVTDPDKKDRYSAELVAKFDQTPGLYRLDSVTVCDRAGNRTTYCTAQDLTDNKALLPVTVTVPVNQ